MDHSENEEEERGIARDNSKGIDTKEAIEVLKGYRYTAGDYQRIIDLIRKLEKYEKMFKNKSTIPEPYPDDASLGGEFF